MIKSLKRASDTISIATLWENYGLSKYNFEPPYQRQSVWTEEKQSFLIDSILRNFPIPAVFLKENINQETGKTTFDIIDGKQRFLAILRFIKNEIPVTSDSESDDGLTVGGRFFREFDNDPKLEELKRHFWSYRIRVEYIDTADTGLIDNVFDRLNRNGEPLSGQELRNATFHSSALVRTIRDLSTLKFWQELLNKLDRSRMEDLEFISELIFLVGEGGPLESNSKLIDELYEKYATDVNTVEALACDFRAITNIMEGFGLNYDEFKISGVSHVYGIFSFAHYCSKNQLPAQSFGPKLKELFDNLRSGQSLFKTAKDYKETMSSRTKSRNQRARRLEALKQQCGIN